MKRDYLSITLIDEFNIDVIVCYSIGTIFPERTVVCFSFLCLQSRLRWRQREKCCLLLIQRILRNQGEDKG